jgi:hypothetical protein
MKASELLEHLRALGVEPVLRANGRLIVKRAGTLPSYVLNTVAAHRSAVKAFLEGLEDRELEPIHEKRALLALGFVELPEVGILAHPRGDEYGTRVLLGLIDPQEIEAALEARVIEKERKTPVVTQVGPGHYTWIETGDRPWADPFPKLTRIDI